MQNIPKIFFLLLTLFLSACKKEIVYEVPISNVQIPENLKDYIVFKPGSYWIYSDSITGGNDSMYIKSVEPDSTNSNFYYGISTVTSRGISVLYNDNFRTLEYDIGELTNGKVDIEMTSDSGYVQSDPHPAMVYPFNINSYATGYDYNHDTSYNDTCRLINKFQTFAINTFSFNNVLEFKNSNNFYGEELKGQPTVYYYAQNIGIVQFKYINTNKNYKLIRYHLN